MPPLRFLLGGVPFGCDNIGDEAILACAVRIVRENFPDASITVATGQPFETERLLGVQAVPLYGFDKSKPLKEVQQAFQGHDVFVWTGATGLSDYPNTTVPLLRLAQKCGLKTVVWGTGMDSSLNAAFFKLGGRKLALAKTMSKLLPGIDCVKAAEGFLQKRMKKQIAVALRKCDLVVVRDYQTQALVRACDSSLDVLTGADSAILCTESDETLLEQIPEETRTALLGGGEKIGLCISAQRAVKDMPALITALDSLLAKDERKVFFIPMNPITDAELMGALREQLQHKEKAYLVKGVDTPEKVLTVAKRCGIVVSSRLHLLILSANIGVPVCGISRGSKVDNFVGQFGLKSAGTVENLNTIALRKQVDDAFADPDVFQKKCATVYQGLHQRLDAAIVRLKAALK